MSRVERPLVGFFGKLPGTGDFVQRRLPDDFVQCWDQQFQQALQTARNRLGVDWPEAWQGAPIWRFLLPANSCGASAWAGVMGPSRDRVGRGFPMVLAAACAGDSTRIGQVLRDVAWFDALAAMHRAGQGDAGLDTRRFDARVMSLPLPNVSNSPAPTSPAIDWSAPYWRLECPGRTDRVWLEQVWGWLASRPQRWCLWWTEAHRGGGPCLLATRGLPQDYTPLLDRMTADALPVHAMSSPGAVDDLVDAEVTGRPSIPPLSSARPMQHKRRAWGHPVQRLAGGRTVLVCADDEVEAADSACAAICTIAQAHAGRGLAGLGEALLALHPVLRRDAGLSADTAAADGAVIAAQLTAGQASLLRIGSATAWHLREGRLRRLFEQSSADDGELGDLLFGPSGPARPGLGAIGQPQAEMTVCRLAVGDRLLLLASRALCGLPQAWLAGAMGLNDSATACRRLAGFAGLAGDPSVWPLTIIEVPA